jgi:hypothetical protein
VVNTPHLFLKAASCGLPNRICSSSLTCQPPTKENVLSLSAESKSKHGLKGRHVPAEVELEARFISTNPPSHFGSELLGRHPVRGSRGVRFCLAWVCPTAKGRQGVWAPLQSAWRPVTGRHPPPWARDTLFFTMPAAEHHGRASIWSHNRSTSVKKQASQVRFNVLGRV